MSVSVNKGHDGYILVAVLRQHQSTQRQSSIIRNSASSNNDEQSTSRAPSAGELLLSLNAPQGLLRHNDSPSMARQTAQCSNHLRPQPFRIPPPDVPPTTRENQEPSENLRDIFPCIHPVNPHMRSSQARLQTFLDNSSIWPAHRIRATPQQIVDAGMYYLGDRDRVKCWYCNGGLQNWERDDDPMEEHAKWFPLCEFVLQQKDSDYVHQTVLRNPGLRRPNLYNPFSGQAAQSLVRTLHSGSSQRTRTPPRNGLINHPVVIDPQIEIAERNRKISEEMRSSNDIAQARMMGFDNDVIKQALKRLVFLIVQFCW